MLIAAFFTKIITWICDDMTMICDNFYYFMSITKRNAILEIYGSVI